MAHFLFFVNYFVLNKTIARLLSIQICKEPLTCLKNKLDNDDLSYILIGYMFVPKKKQSSVNIAIDLKTPSVEIMINGL